MKLVWNCSLFGMAASISYALQEAVVQACGTVFWYKRPLQGLLRRAGVPQALVQKYSDLPKYIMVREILTELDARGDAGADVQRRIARELAAMTTVVDPDNREAGLKALATLRELAGREGVIESDSQGASKRQAAKETAEQRHQVARARARGLAELHAQYMMLATRNDEAQSRGYSLEGLLGSLFKLHDIEYQPPYRKGRVDQTDGFFAFNGFQYLIEARWRKDPPTLGELTAFSGKIKRRIESTRGLFLSVGGFRDDVVDEAASLLNVILVDGQDLALILEGRISLREALQIKLDMAAQRGVLYLPLVERL